MPCNERFCVAAAAFMDELLVRGSRVRDDLKLEAPGNKYDNQRIVSPHRAIHTQLRKYEEVVRHLSLSTDRLTRMTLCFRVAMSKLYELAAYFAWVRKSVHSDQAKQRMASLPSINDSEEWLREGQGADEELVS